MSRAEAYGAFYRESRARLLHQVYAYTGNTDVAHRALADAYITAGHHWRKLIDSPDKDAWMRAQAFRASGRSINRSRRPWYVSAMSTADAHRHFLAVMAKLDPQDRQLLILRYLADLDLPHAGREAGVTDGVARKSLEATATKFALAGVEASPAELTAALARLRLDLSEEPVDRASRLRREGNRRRRSHLLLAGVTSLALAIGAGAVTAAQPSVDPTDDHAVPGPSPVEPTAPAVDPFSVASLASQETLSGLDPSRQWTAASTSPDFGDVKPVHPCLTTAPTQMPAAHYWVRDFTSGTGGKPNEAVEALEVARKPEAANAKYSRLVQSLGSCRTSARQVVDFQAIQGAGDEGSLFTYRYVEGDTVRNERVAVVHSGAVVIIWIVRDRAAHPISSRSLVKLVVDSVDSLCVNAEGMCGIKPYRLVQQSPPAADPAAGFLAAVDLPVFAGLEQPWVATMPHAVDDNPAATDCDRADFAKAGATTVRSRAFVVPGAPQLPRIFGMSETVGTFSSFGSAEQFTREVAQAVTSCEDRQLSLTVLRSDEVHVDRVTGHIWEIQLAASENQNFTFRIALLRVATTVAQITFTPSDDFDVDHEGYVILATRAAQRLTQG